MTNAAFGGPETAAMAALPGAAAGFAGWELRDPLGRRIGRVARVFADGAGSPAHVEVSLGFLGRRTVLLPVGACAVDEARRTLGLKGGRWGRGAGRGNEGEEGRR